MNYYNEIDPFAASWLRELIKAGHIAPGEVDERSIEDVKPSELQGFTQCHFFAGIGVWSYSLRQAGWPDDRPVWTGSCPCQPFSAAGKRKGVADERHLWPSWFHLIEERRPSVIFGEQVTTAIKQGWLDLVQDDLEGIGYSVGAQGLAACNIGAPHQRKRLYFVANSDIPRLERRERVQGGATQLPIRESGLVDDMGHTKGNGRNEGRSKSAREQGRLDATQPSFTNGFWGDVDWLWCRDQKYRPVEPGTFPLAHGAPNRVGRLRGYGNAIVSPVAEAFIGAFIESEKGI